MLTHKIFLNEVKENWRGLVGLSEQNFLKPSLILDFFLSISNNQNPKYPIAKPPINKFKILPSKGPISNVGDIKANHTPTKTNSKEGRASITNLM